MSVVREEFEKLIKGMKDRIQSLEERIEHLENDARTRDVPAVTELSNNIEAVVAFLWQQMKQGNIER